MKRAIHKNLLAAAIGGLLMASSQLGAAGSIQELYQKQDFSFDTIGTQLELIAPFDFESAELRVRQRGSTEVWTQSFGPGDSISANLADFARGPIEDSRYTYEIRFMIFGGSMEAEGEGGLEIDHFEPITFQTTGRFSVVDGEIGEILIPGAGSGATDLPEEGIYLSSKNDGDASLENLTNAGGLAVGGYGVFGSQDTNQIVPGKVRILASGTGASGFANLSIQSFAANNDPYSWHFGTQAGDLGIQRQRTNTGAKVTVLGIEEDAPESSLMITDSGRIGVGTATPAMRLHINETVNDNARIRIENTGSSYDLSTGVITGFRIMQTKPDSRIPFRIVPGAPTNSFRINATGNVGMGTGSPAAALHIRRNNGTAEVRVQDIGAGDQTMFNLVNNGHPIFRLQDTSQPDVRWEFRTTGSGAAERFTVNKIGSGRLEFSVFANGNGEFAGNVRAAGILLTSSRETKTDITPLDRHEVLNKLDALEISQWRYKTQEEGTVHVGPMAEQFHEIFGLSDGQTLNMIDTNGVAFAAIQALSENNRELRERLAVLETRIGNGPSSL